MMSSASLYSPVATVCTVGSPPSTYLDFDALSLDLASEVNKERKVLYANGLDCLSNLPPLVNFDLSTSTGTAINSRKLSSISMILHTGGRFCNEIEQIMQNGTKSPDPLLRLRLTDADVSPSVFDAVIDYMDGSGAAGSLCSGDEAAFIQACAYVQMAPLLACMPRYARRVMYTTCLLRNTDIQGGT